MSVTISAVQSTGHFVKWRAESLACVHFPRKRQGLVPARATAWVLMDRAGMPRDEIARRCEVDEKLVTRWIWIATALMIWPPYAASIEQLSERMPDYRGGNAPAMTPTATGIIKGAAS